MGDEVRTGRVERNTRETRIKVQLDLDGRVAGYRYRCALYGPHAPIVCRAWIFRPASQGQRDLEIDAHHTVEDIGICLGRL